jgi:hypothetical protein
MIVNMVLFILCEHHQPILSVAPQLLRQYFDNIRPLTFVGYFFFKSLFADSFLLEVKAKFASNF